jgi:glycosyltransferase involved in cell wall biosynthesis
MDRAERRRAARMNKDLAPLTALWFSNAPFVGTGYGTQTAQAVKRFQRDGHNIAVSTNYGLQGFQTTWEGIPLFPMGLGAYSEDIVGAHFADWSKQNPGGRPHVFVLFDVWVLKSKHWDEMPITTWTMVDHRPLPPAVYNVVRKPNIKAASVSRFGQQEIERLGIESPYIPFGIDTATYKPTTTFTAGERTLTGRELMGLPDDVFVVSLINANKAAGPGSIHRKAWAEQLLAFSIFAQDKPDVRLYIHTERHGNYGGLNLDALIKAVGLEENKQVKVVNQYAFHQGHFDNDAMAALYTATDVLLAATYGEGAGLTVMEAAACGTRAIVNNFSAQPEFVSTDSWLTENQPYWDGAQLSWFAIPNVPSIVDALEQAYAKGQGRSSEQILHAQEYDADNVWAKHWRPYLATIGGDAPQPEPQPITVADTRPTLTIYIPTARPAELDRLLASLAPQLTDRIEVIISDNADAATIVNKHLADSPARLAYVKNARDIGGDENIVRGFRQGTAPWLWIIGDDDLILPGGVAQVLAAIDDDDADRLILLSDKAPQAAAGVRGTIADIAAADPALPIAATLITANVQRRAALDIEAAEQRLETKYGQAWAVTTCKRVRVLDVPIMSVGANHAGEGVPDGYLARWPEIMRELLADGYGLDEHPGAFAWNYVTAANT